MVEVLKERNEMLDQYICKCLSNSNICGSDLRKSHYYLGFALGKQIIKERNLLNKKIDILIMIRSGLPFGFGIADSVEENNFVNVNFSTDLGNNFDECDIVLVVDAVINTGNTIIDIVKKNKNRKTIVATNVISNKAVNILKDIDIFATRISERHFKGEKVQTIANGIGPDTGERLFNNSFFK